MTLLEVKIAELTAMPKSHDPVAGFLWHFLWCCASIAALVLSQAIYSWVWIWEARNAPFHESRLVGLYEVCAPGYPYRSMFPHIDCDRWENWKSRLDQ